MSTDANDHRDTNQPVLEVKNLSLYYGEKRALKNISMHLGRNKVTAFIGPSGCGKSTLLRCFNRMNDMIDNARIRGCICLNGDNIYSSRFDLIGLRRRVGMVFQKSNPFPMSIYENVVFGLRIAGIKSKRDLDPIVESALQGAALWDEVKDRLNEDAMSLSAGQMQRLCIARAIAVNPEVILMDEPCSALDPIATAKVERLIHDLKAQYSVLIVTHNMQQAARVADDTAFLFMGELVELSPTKTLFTNPVERKTEDYITGRFG